MGLPPLAVLETHGLPMEDPWQTLGRPMNQTHGQPMRNPWATTVNPQVTHG